MSEKKKYNRPIEIGYITVDAGLIYLGDPCYLSDDRNPFNNWEEFCEEYGDGGSGLSYPIKHESGMNGKGVVIKTPFGDGVYAVKGHFDSEGRLTKLTIEL